MLTTSQSISRRRAFHSQYGVSTQTGHHALSRIGTLLQPHRDASSRITFRRKQQNKVWKTYENDEEPTPKGRFLAFYREALSCRKAPPEFRFAPSTLRNFVPSGAAHEGAAGHAMGISNIGLLCILICEMHIPSQIRSSCL